MSGHSKWANIRVKKTAQDAARGKVFTRHARLIEMAARAGGDPITNSALRTAIDNAKAENVPNMNIDRAIKKGTGEMKGEAMSEVLYAAYGPGGVAFLVECLTDNKNRTIANVKGIIHKHGGNWAESASVQWMFLRKGVVVAKWTPLRQGSAGQEIEELELKLIDAGAEEMDLSGETIDVTTDQTHWTKVRDLLKAEGLQIMTAGLKYVPTQKMEVKEVETARKVASFVEAIEEDDDVSEVHANADISEEILQKMEA